MFGLFKSDESIRKKFIDAQNVSYRANGHKAVASFNNEVYKVVWDLKYMANQFGTDTNKLEYEIKNSNFQFPDSPEDWNLQTILIENKFEVYELCYRTQDHRLLQLHKTRLV